jgi:rsbT co-antagonist protein RsbR
LIVTEITSKFPQILAKYENELLSDWVQLQLSFVGRRPDLITESDLRRDSAEFIALLREGLQSGDSDVNGPQWAHLREMLSSLSRSRARQGFTPGETAVFVFSFKQPLFARLRTELAKEPLTLADETWAASLLLDKIGLYTTEVFQKSRDEIIRRQQQELLELSTPVVRLWDGVLALPLIGTLDSARTQVVMESLLREIMNTGCSIAIIDITGVPMVDTLVAQHLLKTVAAARLMGADCIISGIRPQIAQTIVHLGVGLADVVTKASLAEAFRVALKRLELTVKPVDHAS